VWATRHLSVMIMLTILCRGSIPACVPQWHALRPREGWMLWLLPSRHIVWRGATPQRSIEKLKNAMPLRRCKPRDCQASNPKTRHTAISRKHPWLRRMKNSRREILAARMTSPFSPCFRVQIHSELGITTETGPDFPSTKHSSHGLSLAQHSPQSLWQMVIVPKRTAVAGSTAPRGRAHRLLVGNGWATIPYCHQPEQRSFQRGGICFGI
jgi:hypothetical protein